ncbi:MAG: hypothetical protein J0M04_14000 [Verrucomicrobia bacterium]|nr:hypothetical protein [Verrucomicrobiota bacterium]
MARLSKLEKQSLSEFAHQPPLRQPSLPVLPVIDYLRALSNLPDSLGPRKPVRFVGNSWKL